MITKIITLIVLIAALGGVSIFSQNNSGSSDSPKILYNTPNPFTQTTTIKFSLKQDCFVKLSVINTSTKSITELVDGSLSAGEHGIIFKAPANINTGYKCVLTAYSEADNSVLYSTEIEMEHKAKP